jgi:hypothetical protein
MRQRVRAFAALGAVALTLGTTAPAAAQGFPRTEVSAGYQLLEFSAADETLSKGWYADVAGNLTRYLGIVFQVGGDYKEVTSSFTNAGVTITATGDLHVHQFMGGVRVSGRARAVVPFGEFLVGGINGSVRGEGSAVANGQTLFATSSSDSSTEFAMQAAGGANIMFTDRIGVRGTVGYVRVFDEDEGVNVIRVAGGVVFGF